MKQATALDILKTGANVFLTGEPGSGKTHTINQYIAWLRERGIYPAVTASTGIASTHIDGSTIHSWSGIGVHKGLTDSQIETIMDKQWVYNQGYVALSRARSLSSLSLEGFNERALEMHPVIVEKDSWFKFKSAQLNEEFRKMSDEEKKLKADNFLKR